MLRRLLTLPSALSLLVCVAAVALWVRSYFRLDSFGWRDAPGSGFQLSSETGEFLLFRVTRVGPGEWGTGWNSFRVSPDLRNARRIGSTFLGFQYYRSPPAASHGVVVAGVPYWFIALAAAALPGLRTARVYRHRRLVLHSRCAVCGYDLRATPDRCPECGTAVRNEATGRFNIGA